MPSILATFADGCASDGGRPGPYGGGGPRHGSQSGGARCAARWRAARGEHAPPAAGACYLGRGTGRRFEQGHGRAKAAPPAGELILVGAGALWKAVDERFIEA